MGVSTAGMSKGLAASQKMLTGFQASIQQTSSLMTTLFGAAVFGAAAVGFKKLVSAGSDVIENQNKIKAVFGDSSDVVIDASNQMADAFGTSKTEFQDAAGVFGALFKNLGYSAGDAAQLSVQMTKLAGDVASFKNIGFDEALLKILSGLTCESEPLNAIGILINETAVKTEAYAMGIAKVGSELNEQQKVQARLSILTKQTADAQGDLAKTADDVANATRGVQGRFENLIGTLGEQLQPLAKAVLGELSTAIAAAGLAWNDYGAQAVSAASTTVAGMGQQAASIGFLQKAIGFIADAWDVVRLGFAAVQSYITAGISSLVGLLAEFAKAVDKVGATFGQDLGISAYLQTVSEDLKRLSGEQWKNVEKKLTEPWPSEGVNAYFENARKKTEALRTELGKAGINPNQFKPVGGGAKSTGARETKFAEAMLAGSEGATNMVLRSRYGGGAANKDNAKTAENTGKIAVGVDKMVALLGKGDAGPQVIPDFS